MSSDRRDHARRCVRLLCATCKILLRSTLLQKVIHRAMMLRSIMYALYLHPIYFALLQNVTNLPPQSGRKSAVMSARYWEF